MNEYMKDAVPEDSGLSDEQIERDEALLRETLATLKAENEKLREALKDTEVKQGEVK